MSNALCDMRRTFLLGLLLIASAACQAQPAVAPAVERVIEMAEQLGEEDWARVVAYRERAYTPSAFERVPADRQIQQTGYLFDRTRGVRVHRADLTGDHEATAVLQSNLTGEWLELAVTVEPVPPHRVVSSRFRSLDVPPDDAPRPAPLSEAEAVRDLGAYMARLEQADYFSGVVLLARGDSVLFHEAYGDASREYRAPNRPDTRFNLASMNKTFTAVAVLQLAEAGRLALEDPVADHLLDVLPPEAGRRVRVEHLLSHTGGVGPNFQRRWGAADPTRIDGVDDWLAFAEGDTLASEPGTAYDYSNAGYAMLGAIVEAVTGQGYYDYVRERVLDPAGMEETGFFRADEVVPNRATGYQKAFTLDGTTFQNTTTWNPQRGGPAGGGYSTAGDLHRFVRALRDGALLRPESVPLLFSAKTDLGAEGYGFGFNVENEPEHIVGHGGAAFGASTNLDVFLDSGYTAVVLSNYGGVVATPVVRHVRQLVDRIQGATE